MISSKTQYPATAAAFLKYMTSQQTAREFVGKCNEFVQVRGAATEDNSTWYLRKYMKIVEEAPVISAWTDTMVERSVAEELMNGIEGMLAGQMSPEQIVEGIRKRQAEVKADLEAQAAAQAG